MMKNFHFAILFLVLLGCKAIPKGESNKLYYEYNVKGDHRYVVLVYDQTKNQVFYLASGTTGGSVVWIYGNKHPLDFLEVL